MANENAIDLVGTKLFYYEIYGLQFDGKSWSSFSPSGGPETSVVLPREQQLEGYDVVTFFAGSSPECSPLSCNGLAEEIPVNSHCLLSTFDEAKAHLEDGTLLKSDPGPYRIFAVYSVN